MRRPGRVELLEPRRLLAGTVFQVNTFETWDANPRIIESTDPAGIAYHPPSGHLFIADSEINENREFADVNVFESALDGTAVFGKTWPGKDSEPTGITWNEADGFFYITNDDDQVIRHFDETFSLEMGSVSTEQHGLSDPEGITSDPSGLLYVVSGQPPLVGIFDNEFNFISSFSTSREMDDAEGIAYRPFNSHLYLVSSADQSIFEYTVDGDLVEEYSLADLVPPPETPQGLTFGPCTDDPGLQCLYIADGGEDNEPDGRIYEVRIGDISLPNRTTDAEASVVTFTAIHDAHTKSTRTGNYGDVDHLRARNGRAIYESFLKFDVSGLGESIQSATLRLFVVDGSKDGGNLYAVSNDYLGSTTPWEEDGLTVNNAPSIGGEVLASAAEVEAGQWVEFDVTAAITENGIYSFGLNSNSSNSVMYSSSEGSDPPQLVIQSTSVTPVNHAPLADDQSLTTSGETAIEITLTGHDVDGDTLTFVIDTDPSHGTLAGDIPNLTYTPNPTFAGTDSFTFHVNDGTVDSDFATVEIAVNSANQPPVANDQSTSTDEDTSAPIILTGSDPDGDPLGFSIVDGPSNGTLSGTVPSLTYTPNENFNGSDSFRFKVNDGTEDSTLATVSISVNAINDLPVAEDLTRTTTKDNSVSVLLSGSDIDGDVLSYSVTSGPSDGSLQGTAPNLTYTPNAGFVGSDAFTYHVHDGSTASNPATVTIHVTNTSAPVTISFQDEAFPSPAYRGTRDTKIRGDFPERILGTSRKLEVDGKPDMSTLIKWDISNIPAGSFVQSASITMNVVNTTEDEFEIYQALQAWSEAEASYNERQAGVPWQIAGASGPADRGATILGSVTSPALGTMTFELNDAGRAVVQSWIDDPLENWGFVIQDYTDASTQDMEFSSRENRDPLLRPKLTIVYAGDPADDDDTAGFDIDLAFADDRITSSQRQAFAQAASRWSEIITGDLPPLTNSSGTIDDLRIEVSLSNIDGAGGVLGNAGPTFVRPSTFLPARGVIRIDEADIATLESSGQFFDLIVHEMGHVLGIGSIWRSLNLLSGFGGSDPRFTGPAATAEYNVIFGLNESSVPVENTGPSGTRDAHWRESALGNELMTGYLSSGSNPLSRITVASLQDLGYEVNMAAADAFIPIANPVVVTGHFADVLQSPIVLDEQPGEVAVPWRNTWNSADVNDDGHVSPLDALRIINELNTSGARPLTTFRPVSSPFLDVSGDNSISPIDALLVINALNHVSAEAEGDVLYVASHLSTENWQGMPMTAIGPTLSVEQRDVIFASAIGTSRPTDTRTLDRRDPFTDELVDSVWTDDNPFDLLFVE